MKRGATIPAMIDSRRGVMVAAAGLLLLGGCSGDKITDASSPEAKACKDALTAGIDKAVAASKETSDGKAKSLRDLVPKENPPECKDIDNSLGSRLAYEVAAELAAKIKAE